MILNFIINLGGSAVLVIGVIYIGLLLSALYLILKHEKGLMLAFWLIVVLSLPFVGSLLYLAKHLLVTKPKLQS
jgi:uncharacterized membrane protein